jgi:hypothetical protein
LSRRGAKFVGYRPGAACVALGFFLSCKRPLGDFRVLPAQPQYLLRSPDTTATPFGEVLNNYNGFIPGKGWLDLRPDMELRVENAYYQAGAAKRGLSGFLGTEIAQYRIESDGGLRLLSVQHMQNRPVDQEPVQQLISGPQKNCRTHRFYFEVLFRQSARGSVLLGANSTEELRELSDQLLKQPDSVCNGHSAHCTVFPEACSVSLEMRIFVNGRPQTVGWGSLLASVASKPQRMDLLRVYEGRLINVEIDPHDPQALRLPLLPGDRIHWN